MYLSNGSPMWWIFIKGTILYVNQTKQIHKLNSRMRFFEWLQLDFHTSPLTKCKSPTTVVRSNSPVCITLLISYRYQNNVVTVPVGLGAVAAAAGIVCRKQPIFSDRRDWFPIPGCGYALRVAVMNGVAGLDPCDYLGQSATATFNHELWNERREIQLADWRATSVICLTLLSWKTGSWTCHAFVTFIISGYNYHK